MDGWMDGWMDRRVHSKKYHTKHNIPTKKKDTGIRNSGQNETVHAVYHVCMASEGKRSRARGILLSPQSLIVVVVIRWHIRGWDIHWPARIQELVVCGMLVLRDVTNRLRKHLLLEPLDNQLQRMA